MFRRIGLMAAGFAVVAAACGSGSTDDAEVVSAPPQATDAPAAKADSSAKDEGNNEGIKVHGHWKIVVTNPDGTVASTTEFENALVDSGASTLARLLDTGDPQPVFGWVIRAFGTGSIIQAGDISPISCASECNIGDSQFSAGALTVANVDDTLVLVSTGTGAADGEISRVSTFARQSTSVNRFTEKTLDAPVPFVADQEIEVTVEISFS